MTIEERIEKHVRDSFYQYKSEADIKGHSADEAFKGYIKRMLAEVAEAAKLEERPIAFAKGYNTGVEKERKRIEEALNNTPEGSCFYCMRKKECCIPHDILTLDQVRSIINPK